MVSPSRHRLLMPGSRRGRMRPCFFYFLFLYIYDTIPVSVGVPSMGCEDPIKLRPKFWMKSTPTSGGWRAVNNVGISRKISTQFQLNCLQPPTT